jgi:tRNA A37 N6-isopentenylltransferase MiaA
MTDLFLVCKDVDSVGYEVLGVFQFQVTADYYAAQLNTRYAQTIKGPANRPFFVERIKQGDLDRISTQLEVYEGWEKHLAVIQEKQNG